MASDYTALNKGTSEKINNNIDPSEMKNDVDFQGPLGICGFILQGLF